MAEPTMPVAASSVPSPGPCGSRAQPAAPTELEVITVPVHLLEDVVRQHPGLAPRSHARTTTACAWRAAHWRPGAVG